MALDMDKLHEFLGRFVTDLGATFAAGNVVTGHHLGLYRALAAGPARAAELAERTSTDPRYIAAVWGQDGVRVNALVPGYFPTELTGFLADAGFAQEIRDRTLLGRTPDPGELDGPLLFLATGASSYMTGRALVIDGGWTAV